MDLEKYDVMVEKKYYPNEIRYPRLFIAKQGDRSVFYSKGSSASSAWSVETEYMLENYIVADTPELQTELINAYETEILDTAIPECCFYCEGTIMSVSLKSIRSIKNWIDNLYDHDFYQCLGFKYPAYPGEPPRKNQPDFKSEEFKKEYAGK